MDDFDVTLPSANLLSTPLTTTEIRLRSNEILVRGGAPLRGVITVQSGRLKRLRRYGKHDFLVGLVGRDESVGLREILRRGTARRHRETLEAVGETVVTIEPLERVDAWLAAAPPGLMKVLCSSAVEFRREDVLRRPLNLLPVRARVAATLWILIVRHGAAMRDRPGVRALDLGLTREEIAHLAGTVYESVIRTLTIFKKEGLIDLEGRVIYVLKEDQLARIGQIVIGETHDQNTIG